MLRLNSNEVYFGKFPNGESYADIDAKNVNTREPNTIYLKFEDDSDIFHLICLKDFVDDFSLGAPCRLLMPYIPYSRMDRKEEKRLFTLKSFARLINSMGFVSVEVMEPHSEVSCALIDRIVVENKSAKLSLTAMRDTLDLRGTCWFNDSIYCDDSMGTNMWGMFTKAREAGIYFVYPDAGAEKRYRKQIKYDKVLTCNKTRDFNTGRITSLVVNGAAEAQDCKVAIIVDDLSSKGGTFVLTAERLFEELPNLEKVILCVAHCENTILEGDVIKGDKIAVVYTTDSIIKLPYESDQRKAKIGENKFIIESSY